MMTWSIDIKSNNGHGIYINWFLASGSDYTSSSSALNQWSNYQDASWAHGQAVDITSSTDNYFQLTGVQLEVGSVATDFEHRSFGDELLKCFRYFYKTYDYDTAIGTATSVGAFVYSLPVSQTYAAVPSVRYPVEMRDNPTVTAYSTANANTTGKMTADSTDKSTVISYIGRKGHYPFVNNSSSGISVNVWLRHQFTAESEL